MSIWTDLEQEMIRFWHQRAPKLKLLERLQPQDPSVSGEKVPERSFLWPTDENVPNYFKGLRTSPIRNKFSSSVFWLSLLFNTFPAKKFAIPFVHPAHRYFLSTCHARGPGDSEAGKKGEVPALVNLQSTGEAWLQTTPHNRV